MTRCKTVVSMGAEWNPATECRQYILTKDTLDKDNNEPHAALQELPTCNKSTGPLAKQRIPHPQLPSLLSCFY